MPAGRGAKRAAVRSSVNMIAAASNGGGGSAYLKPSGHQQYGGN